MVVLMIGLRVDAVSYTHLFKETQIALSKAGAAGAARIKEIMDNLRKDAPQEIGGVKVVKVEDYGNSTCLLYTSYCLITESGAPPTVDTK